MNDEMKLYFNRLKEQLEPVINELAKTHSADDIIRIEYPVGNIQISFKNDNKTDK